MFLFLYVISQNLLKSYYNIFVNDFNKMIGEKMMDQKAFIESIDSTIDRLKKKFDFIIE